MIDGLLFDCFCHLVPLAIWIVAMTFDSDVLHLPLQSCATHFFSCFSTCFLFGRLLFVGRPHDTCDSNLTFSFQSFFDTRLSLCAINHWHTHNQCSWTILAIDHAVLLAASQLLIHGLQSASRQLQHWIDHLTNIFLVQFQMLPPSLAACHHAKDLSLQDAPPHC